MKFLRVGNNYPMSIGPVYYGHPMPHMDRRNNELFNARIRHASVFFFEFLKHEQIRHKIGKDIKKNSSDSRERRQAS